VMTGDGMYEVPNKRRSGFILSIVMDMSILLSSGLRFSSHTREIAVEIVV
jgi:hypothetical protein